MTEGWERNPGIGSEPQILNHSIVGQMVKECVYYREIIKFLSTSVGDLEVQFSLVLEIRDFCLINFLHF